MGRAGIDAARMRFWAGAGAAAGDGQYLAAPQSQPAPVVDEPLGARYSLAHAVAPRPPGRANPAVLSLRGRKLSPEKLLPRPVSASGRDAASLLEPVAARDQLNGWQVEWRLRHQRGNR